MTWLLLAPLAPGLIWCSWVLWRERDLRLLLVATLLAVLAGRQFVVAPPEAEGLAQLVLTQQLAPLLADFAVNLLASLAAIAIGRSVVERNRAEQVHWEGMEALRSLATFFNAPHQNFNEALDELLRLGCEQLRTEIGLVSRIEGDEYDVLAICGPETLSLHRGERLPLADTFCHQTAQRDQVVAIEDTSVGAWKQHPAAARLGFGSYLGAPLRVNDAILGTLCFAGVGPRRGRFSGTDNQILGLMAHWVGKTMAEREAWRGLGKLTRQQQASLELSRQALHRAEPERLHASIERIAYALDTPLAAVLQVERRRSQSDDPDGLLLTAGIGWRDGTLGSIVPIAETCLGPALFKGETVAIENFANSDGLGQPALFESHEVMAAACVPIASADRQVGILAVCSPEARAFREDELSFLRLSANLLASAHTAESPDEQAARGRSDPSVAAGGKRAARPVLAADRRRVAVDAAVDELEELLRGAAGPGVRLVLDLAASGGETRMFRHEFERILWGLVLQATDLARGQGELRIETRRLAAGGGDATSDAFLTLAVGTTHAALDGEAMSDLMDRDGLPHRDDDAQSPMRTRPREKTTASRRVSLPRIRRMLRSVGGDLSAQSGVGEGTTFTAYLPALPPKSLAPEAPRHAPKPGPFARE